MVAEATLFLVLSRIGISCLPYSAYRRFLGKHRYAIDTIQMPLSTIQRDEKKIKIVSYWVNKVARSLPMDCSCLPRAMAGRFMLRLRRIDCTLYLGLGKDPRNKLIAHAWLKAGGIKVTGGEDQTYLVEVAWFG